MIKPPESAVDIHPADAPTDDQFTTRVRSDPQERFFGDHAFRRHHPETLVGQFLHGEAQEGASDDREKLPPQYRKGLLHQFAGPRDEVAGSHQEADTVGQSNLGE